MEQRIYAAARPYYTDQDPAHDWDHICRVCHFGRVLCREENADEAVVIPAAMFHDCVKLRVGHSPRDDSSRLSAEGAEEELLKIEGYPKEKITEVKLCIYEHSLALGIRPESLNSKVLQDADRLDSLGMVAIMRIFAHCGTWGGRGEGGRLFFWYDPFCENGREPDNKACGLDWVALRLSKIVPLLNTTTAKRLAMPLERNQNEFLARLRGEIGFFPSAEMQAMQEMQLPARVRNSLGAHPTPRGQLSDAISAQHPSIGADQPARK